MENLVLFSLSALSQVVFCAIIYYSSQGEADKSKDRLRNRFYLLAIAMVVWCGSQYAYDVSLSVSYQSRVLKTAVIVTVWVAFAFLLFSRELIQKRATTLRKFLEWGLAIAATSAGLLFTIATPIVEGNAVTYEFNPLLYGSLTLIPLIYIFESIYFLERFSRRARRTHTIEARQAKFVARGMLITTIFAFAGNFIFSFLGLDSTIIANLSVALAPAIFTISVGYAVFSLKLFNFRKFLLKVVIYGGVFVAIYGTMAALVSVAGTALIDKNEYLFGILFFGTALLTYPLSANLSLLLLNKVGKNPKSDEVQINHDVQDILRKINTQEVLEGLAEILQARFLFDSVHIGLFTDQKETQMIGISRPNREFHSKEVGKLIKDESDNAYVDQLTLHKYELGTYQLGFIMKRDLVNGVILVGEKTDGRPVYDDERAELVSLAGQAALALENSLQYYKIQRFNEELEQKIADATKELRRTNEKLKELDEAKDEFISMASHQLRTPLTSVKGYVSMVLEGDAGRISQQQKDLLEQAFGSAQRMVYLIADLLNVSRLKTGKFIIESVPTDLSTVVESEVAQLVGSAKARGLSLIYDKPANFPVLNLDETKTRQVIMNFIDNAIYYTPNGGNIQVFLKADEKTIEFKVVDNGLGVPKAEQPHLFTKFYRADNAKKARPDGTGLGLFMAKKVIVSQGGALIFTSQEGKGSTFGFSFPRHQIETKKT